jgi:hypothetical protein
VENNTTIIFNGKKYNIKDNLYTRVGTHNSDATLDQAIL